MSEHLLAFAVADRWLWSAKPNPQRLDPPPPRAGDPARSPAAPVLEPTPDPAPDRPIEVTAAPPPEPVPGPAPGPAPRQAAAKPHPAPIHPLWTDAGRDFESGAFEEALQLYRQIAGGAGSRTESALAAYDAGLCLWQLGRYTDAAASFRSAIQTDPSLPQASLGLAWCHLHLREAAEAAAGFDAYLRLHPADRATQRGRAQALQMMAKAKEAALAYQEFAEEEQTNPDLLANLIALAADQKNIAALSRYSGQLLHLRPRSRQALAGIATAELTTANYEAGLEHIQDFLRIEPKSFEAWFNSGLAADLSGATETAVHAYRRARALAPTRWEPMLNEAAILLERENLADAARSLDSVLALDPRNITALWNLSLLSERTGDFEKAEAYAQTLLDDDPSKIEVLLHIGYLRFRNNNWPGSIQAFQTCLTHRLNWLEARLFLALAYWNTGDREGAAAQLDLALHHDPIFIPALQCRLVLALHNRDAPAAHELEAQLADLGHTSPEFCYNVGVLLQRSGAIDDAIVAYRRAVGKRPAFAEALINLGHALRASGKDDEAREAWQKAISAQPELAKNYFGA